jgi:hypothetical protein
MVSNKSSSRLKTIKLDLGETRISRQGPKVGRQNNQSHVTNTPTPRNIECDLAYNHHAASNNGKSAEKSKQGLKHYRSTKQTTKVIQTYVGGHQAQRVSEKTKKFKKQKKGKHGEQQRGVWHTCK